MLDAVFLGSLPALVVLRVTEPTPIVDVLVVVVGAVRRVPVPTPLGPAVADVLVTVGGVPTPIADEGKAPNRKLEVSKPSSVSFC